MAQLVSILGPTGAGKTVQAARLAQERGWVHLSTGELLRQDPAMKAFLETGQLASSEQVNAIVAQALETTPGLTGIVLDGFPRELSQAQWLDEWLVEHHWPPILSVISIAIDQPTTTQRLASRGRTDDSSHAQAIKWQAYEVATKPVLDYYQEHHLLARVDGHGTMDEVAARIGAALA